MVFAKLTLTGSGARGFSTIRFRRPIDVGQTGAPLSLPPDYRASSQPTVLIGTIEDQIMKMIEAIIQPAENKAVKEALNEVEVVRLTIVTCKALAAKKVTLKCTVAMNTVNLLRKVKVQIAVNDGLVDKTVMRSSSRSLW